MEHRALGNTGLAVSVLGLGCNHLGAQRRTRTRADMVRLLEHSLDRGITFFEVQANMSVASLSAPSGG